MALIKNFIARPEASVSFRTEVDCGYKVESLGDKTFLHLETYGSRARAIPGKVSQSLELDERGARELIRIIEDAFPQLVAR